MINEQEAPKPTPAAPASEAKDPAPEEKKEAAASGPESEEGAQAGAVAAGALVLECFSLVGQDDLGGFDKGRGLGELVLSFGIFLPLIVEDGHGAIGMVFLVGRSGSKKDLVHVPGDIQPVQAGDRKMLGDRIQTEDMLDLRASPILIGRYHGPAKNGGLGKGIDLVK